jgi:hypothetical protein
MWLAASSAFAAVLFAAPAADEPAAAQARGREQLRAMLSPLLQGSGTWRAPNHEHVAGDAQSAAFWRLEHEWAFEATLMRYRIVGQFEDGRTTIYWEGSVAWDPRLEIARVTQVHRAGIYGSGELRRLDADALRFQMTFWHPGGGAEQFRDDLRWSGAGAMESRSQSYDAKEWKWVEKRVEQWTLLPAEAGVGGVPNAAHR